MTHCFGWKNETTVFLISDTSLSHENIPKEEYTSFKQLQEKSNGLYVEEALLKIVPIADGLVFAFSGDVPLAIKILEFIKEGFSNLTVENFIERVFINFGPFSTEKTVEFLIADSRGTKPYLYYWCSLNPILIEEKESKSIGSLSEPHIQNTEKFLNFSNSIDSDEDKSFIAFISLLQSVAIYENLIKENVCGAYLGIKTSNKKNTWMQDMRFIVYDENFKNNVYVCVIYISNAVLINSSEILGSKALLNTACSIDSELFKENSLPKAINHSRTENFRYWIFISSKEKSITVLERNIFQIPSSLVKLEYFEEKDELHIFSSNNMKNELKVTYYSKIFEEIEYKFRFIKE